MQQIFSDSVNENNTILITGDDAHHLIRVVRIRLNEQIRVSTKDGNNYLCEISNIFNDSLEAKVISQLDSTELKNKIYLFQALPKGDRIETIIEKCVELGVYEIIPVEMKNCVVKLDDKKKKNRLERYNAIANSAAKQSKRSIVPQVRNIMSMNEAYEYAKSLDISLVPYEAKHGMQDTFSAIDKISASDSIAVFVGPEGGFDDSEIEILSQFSQIISLGQRILRTDTAAIAALSMLMLKSEEFN